MEHKAKLKLYSLKEWVVIFATIFPWSVGMCWLVNTFILRPLFL